MPNGLLLTPQDAVIQSVGPIEADPVFKKPSVIAEAVLRAKDFLKSRLRGCPADCDVIGKSGHSQTGIHPKILEEAEIAAHTDHVTLPLRITSLGDDESGLANWLSVMKSSVERGIKLGIGRIMVSNELEALQAFQIREAIEQSLIWLPEGAEVLDSGVVEVPLSQVEYWLNDDLMTDQYMQQVLVDGKHGLYRVQGVAPGGKADFLEANSFFVGAIKVSVGPYTAVIDPHVTDGTFHLPARVLDSFRTTGKSFHRQVEIFHHGKERVNTDDLRIRLRFYPSTTGDTPLQTRIFGTVEKARRIVKEGLGFEEAVGLDNEKLEKLFRDVTPQVSEDGYFARLLSSAGEYTIPWWGKNKQHRDRGVAHEFLYQRLLRAVHEKWGKHRWSQPLEKICEALEYVGGAQNQQRAMITHYLPDIQTLGDVGKRIGTFVFRGINTPKEAFLPGEMPEEDMPNLAFGLDTYRNLCRLAREGKKFLIQYAAKGIEPHLRTFYQGFWMKPEDKERFDNIGTGVAMFGSHVDGLDSVLEEDLDKLMSGLKELFEEEVFVAHGKGPGIMKLADEAAEKHGVFRVGAGIIAKGQKQNFKPEAQVDFRGEFKHERQHILDSTTSFGFKFYNIGGNGTLEESAIAMTNTKLFEVIPMPMIYVDQTQDFNEGRHLWTDLRNQVCRFAEERKKSDQEGDTFMLTRSWMPDLLALVGSCEQGLEEVIKPFVEDPCAYWRQIGISGEEMETSYEKAQGISERTGISIPPYLKKAMEEYIGGELVSNDQ